ncbi:IS3 family transposase (plasmid) [Rhodococcus globerulus]|uniref:IS3 family transposase n=1 Tax=Rhodococcus globerulus TaxID=33008 RepID=UPI0039EC75CE
MAKEGLPVQTACRVLEVSESGLYEWRNQPRAERSLRHACLAQLITEVRTARHGTYGARRVRTEPTLGHGIAVGHGRIKLLMRAAGLNGLLGPNARSPSQTPCASDLVDCLSAGCGSASLLAERCEICCLVTGFIFWCSHARYGRCRGRRGRVDVVHEIYSCCCGFVVSGLGVRRMGVPSIAEWRYVIDAGLLVPRFSALRSFGQFGPRHVDRTNTTVGNFSTS